MACGGTGAGVVLSLDEGIDDNGPEVLRTQHSRTWEGVACEPPQYVQLIAIHMFYRTIAITTTTV